MFYACRDCNTYKGDYWPTNWQKIKREFVLNPCDHDFEIHFDFSRDEWIGKTKTGRWNLKKLRLNSVQRIKIRNDRRVIYDIIEPIKRQLSLAQNTLAKAKAQQNLSTENECISIISEISDLNRKIDAMKRKIEGAMN